MEKTNIQDKKFGKLTALSFHHKDKDRRYYWLFRCDCGKEKIIRKSHVIAGGIQSCGCSQFKKGSDSHLFVHGMTDTKFYRAFQKIQEKCYAKNSADYKYYGGRGIKCEWKSFMEFKKDMYRSFLISMKKHGAKNTTIDRIDVNGNYSKQNCKWSTYLQQERNRTNTKRYLFLGKNLTIAEWCEIYDLPIYYINNRVRRNRMSVAEILKQYIATS